MVMTCCQVLHGPAGAIMSAGAARPAPSRPRVESIWTFPEGYEVTARAATETATRLRRNQDRPGLGAQASCPASISPP